MKKTRSRRTPKRRKPFRHPKPKVAPAQVTVNPPMPDLSLATEASLMDLEQLLVTAGLLTPAEPTRPMGPAELARMVEEREG